MNMTKKHIKEISKLIIFSGVVLWAVLNYKMFIDILQAGIKLLTPLIVGIGIAFIINVPMKQIENKVFKIEKRKHKRLIRGISLFTSILLMLGIIGLLMFLVIPEFIEAINGISESIPKSRQILSELVIKLEELYPNIEDYFKNIDLKSILNSVSLTTSGIVSIIISFITSLISRIVVFCMGFILAIYILIDKEKFAMQSKKVIRAFCSDKVSNKIFEVVKLVNTTFTNFLTGQFLNACVVGFLFFLLLSIIRIPYALILGVLFTFTALIPYIGAFITLVVGIVLIGVINPLQVIWYVIAFFAIQQFDDSVTGPKIVGGSVGLPPLWSLIAVLVGGSLFGILGIVISIPLASIIYVLLKDFVNKKLEEKNN